MVDGTSIVDAVVEVRSVDNNAILGSGMATDASPLVVVIPIGTSGVSIHVTDSGYFDTEPLVYFNAATHPDVKLPVVPIGMNGLQSYALVQNNQHPQVRLKAINASPKQSFFDAFEGIRSRDTCRMFGSNALSCTRDEVTLRSTARVSSPQGDALLYEMTDRNRECKDGTIADFSECIVRFTVREQGLVLICMCQLKLQHRGILICSIDLAGSGREESALS